MRTLIIIIGGFLLLALCLGAARLLGGADTAMMRKAVWVFLVLWFCAAAINMWIGVSRADYPFMEELPIFLLIFSLPAAAALIIWWKFL